MRFGKLELALSIIGAICLIASMPLVICMNHTTQLGDSANWLQAIVAILTLLGVIYAAIRASDAANSAESVARQSNEISQNSTILSERSYMASVLAHLAIQANDALSKQTFESQKWDECADMISRGGEPARTRAITAQNDLFANITKDKRISVFVTSILKCHHIIDSCKHSDPNYYKEILKAYLDTDAIIELKNERQLQWVCKDFKSHPAGSQFHNQALALEKNYTDARNFLDLKRD